MSQSICEICNTSMSTESFMAHKMSSKHKLAEDRVRVENLEKTVTGLLIHGVPPGVSAVELQMIFGKFGSISKISLNSGRAYLHYTDKSAHDAVLKQNHSIHGQVLVVKELSSTPQKTNHKPPQNYAKRDAQGKFRNSPHKNLKNEPSLQEQSSKRLRDAAMAALSKRVPLNEQFAALRSVLKAEDDFCMGVIQYIYNDLMEAFKSSFVVHNLLAFGSMTTGLAFVNSDLDIYAHIENKYGAKQTSPKKLFQIAKRCFFSRQYVFTNIVPIPATRVPIIKFVHMPTNVSCDLNFNNAIGFHNSKLLRHYLHMNEKIFDLLFFLKFWAGVHGLVSPSKLSNFALSMLGLSFLFSLRDASGKKILPSIQELMSGADTSNLKHIVSGWKCGFNETPISITLPDTPEFSVLGLLKKFFEYITEVPFKTHVISSLTGEFISREVVEKNPSDLPPEYEPYLKCISKNPNATMFKACHCAVIHDPFQLDHNLMGRISEKCLSEFIAACKVSAEKCSAVMDSDDAKLRLLYNLVQIKTRTEASSKKCKTVCVMNRLLPEGCPFKTMLDFIILIFEKILLIKVTSKSEDSESDTVQAKVRKTDEMRDIHGKWLLGVFNGEGSKNVWSNRKQTRSTLNKSDAGLLLSNPLTIENEQYITGILLTHAKNHHPDTLCIKFKCEVYYDNGKIRLNFHDLAGKQKGSPFECFISFLCQHLPKWISTLPITCVSSVSSTIRERETQSDDPAQYTMVPASTSINLTISEAGC